MIYNIQYHLVSDIASEPIDTIYLKQQARIDFNADDNLLQDYIVSARQELEKWSGLSFGVKTWRLTADWLPNKYRITKKEVDALTVGDYVLLGQTVSSDTLCDNHIKDVDLEFTTKALADTEFQFAAKNAVAQMAAYKYAQRFNVMTDTEGKPINASSFVNEAHEILRPFKVVVIC